MPPIGDSLSNSDKEALFKSNFKKGDVFATDFAKVDDHQKYFIVVGLSPEKTYTCTVFINSRIHPSILRKSEIANLQIPITKIKNTFLNHDSFVCCSDYTLINFEKIEHLKNEGKCRVLGTLHEEDLNIVTKTIIDSGLLTPDELKLYFQV